ncbi:MAG: protein translocase subunit SecF [Gammaproteobacteria bacterium]|nr:protein translocase subunit SecF [Gammaproteobacteria bacterium]
MEIFKRATRIDFLGRRKLALTVSTLLLVAGLSSLLGRGLNFGIDFSGGTLVEVGYEESVEIESVRGALREGGFSDAVVQHFGTARDVLVRLPAGSAAAATSTGGDASRGDAAGSAARLSERLINVLRAPFGEQLSGEESPGGLQQCVSVRGDALIDDSTVADATVADAAADSTGESTVTDDSTVAPETAPATTVADCRVQMRRVEFVGPQVGDELANQGGLAMLYALIGVLVYVTFRFEWRFAVGSVIALAHDVLVTVGIFSLFQFEFSLPVLAAVLAVIGYSLNDTIVVYDRIRENFRKMRKHGAVDIINISINQTLPRTVLTSLTTLFVVLTLLIFGGEVIRGFAIALFIGVVVGTYSSVFVASPVVLALGITREDMLPVKKEGEDAPAAQP